MPPRASLHNRTTGVMLSETAFLLTSLSERFLGRLTPGLPSSSVVGLSPCDWIHTFGLRAPLDVAYCDQRGCVLSLALGLLPNRLPRPVRGTATTWEADAGVFTCQVCIGDVLELSPVPSALLAGEIS